MLRPILAGTIGLLLFAGATYADEIKNAILKSYDTETKKLTVTVEGEEKTFTVSEDATMTRKVMGEEKTVKIGKRKKSFITEKNAGKLKATLTVEDNEVTKIEMTGRVKDKDK